MCTRAEEEKKALESEMKIRDWIGLRIWLIEYL
jgi:hypothetical protein